MIWVQLVGLVGVALIIATWQFNKRETILRIQLLSGLAWAVHFTLLGAYTGAAMNLIMSGRNYLFDRYRSTRYVFWVALGVIMIASIVTWHGWSSSLPLTASIISTFAVWMKKPRHIRLLMLAVPMLWFGYNAVNGSYAGMLGDSITFVALLIGVYRFDIRGERQPVLQPEAVTVREK